MEPLKNMFNSKVVSKIASEMQKSYSAFDQLKFKKQVMKDLENLELKERSQLIADCLYIYLPKDYKKSVAIILKSLADEKNKDNIEWDRLDDPGILGMATWPLNDYIQTYGLDDYKTSMHAMKELTKRFSSEFTIRPFIERYDQRVYDDLAKLIKHKNTHVRRWISEGTRPNLPWGMKCSKIHSNLERNIPLLEALYDDPKEYVRRSVANHLNDISKLDKKIMLKSCKKFLKESNTKETQWLVKHANRGLLKKGDKDALVLNGYVKIPKVTVSKFKLSKKKITEGDSFDFSFNLKSESKTKQKLILEYIIHYPKKNGKLSPKAFRLKDFVFEKNGDILIQKTLKFIKVSTRVHYPGLHMLEIQVNGEVLASSNFTLK